MMAERHFTYQDIEVEFIHRCHKMTPTTPAAWKLESIHLLWELTPPTWIVRYTVTYYKGTPLEFTASDSMLFIEKRDSSGNPWLNGPMWHELPKGAASPAEEDTEIERKLEAWVKKWEARHVAEP